jgi:hypothetical protein
MGERPIISGQSMYVATLAFMSLFEGIKVRNYETEAGRFDLSQTTMWIPVSVVLDTKEKIYEQIMMGGHKAQEQADTRLPKLGIQITAMNPAIERYTGKDTKRILLKTINNSVVTNTVKDLQPVPFDISFTVTVWCAYMEHWVQIMENILPWFDPYMHVGVMERHLGIERQIRVVLESVSPNFSFQMAGPTDKRIIRGELTFRAETVVYKNQTTNISDIIETVNNSIIDVITPWSNEMVSVSGSAIYSS